MILTILFYEHPFTKSVTEKMINAEFIFNISF